MKIPPIVARVYSEFAEDRIPAVAGGITFFFLLALFPAVASIVSLYGLFADRKSIVEGLNMVSGFLPGGAVTVLRTEILRLVAQKPQALGLTFFISMIVALWSASGGVKALLDGLNIAFETKENRSFLRITANALIFTVIGAILTSVAIFLVVQLNELILRLPHSQLLGTAFQIVAWPIGFFLCSLVLSVIYRYGPNRTHTPWHWITWGSALAAAAWLAGTLLFSWYVQNFGRYNRTYGDLGSAVGFLTWVWLSLVILLTGAEIICEIERRDGGKQPKRATSERIARQPAAVE